MKKNTLSMLLALSMAFTLAACAGGGIQTQDTSASDSTTAGVHREHRIPQTRGCRGQLDSEDTADALKRGF